jgi:hypothetical protein
MPPTELLRTTGLNFLSPPNLLHSAPDHHREPGDVAAASRRAQASSARTICAPAPAGASHRSLLTQPEPGLQRNPESVVVTAAL